MLRPACQAEGDGADAKFLVVGEELTMPPELITQNRLDGLWNKEFQSLVRAAILGETFGDLNFRETVQRVINCTRNPRDNSIDLRFSDGANAINYLTSHDVQGTRKERLYNLMLAVIKVDGNQDIENVLHRARLGRIKLGFVCLLTAVGIPMILAGEEFGDQHDLFNSRGDVTHEGGKQVDPVNFSRVNEPARQELFNYVARLVKLCTSHPTLSVNDTVFIHHDFSEDKRVVVWKRGSDANPVVVVANFSDFTTPFAPGAQYGVLCAKLAAYSRWTSMVRSDAKPSHYQRET